jgi:hypothetical protein
MRERRSHSVCRRGLRGWKCQRPNGGQFNFGDHQQIRPPVFGGSANDDASHSSRIQRCRPDTEPHDVSYPLAAYGAA